MPHSIPRRLVVGMLAAGLVLAFGVAPASASVASGERMLGQTAIEPAYNDMTGGATYLLTPVHAPNPINANPKSWAPIYLPVYPTGSTVGTLNCMNNVDNCPDHDALVTGAAQMVGATLPVDLYAGGAIGHDHLLAPPASGGDFNIAWQPVLVLFTSMDAANAHPTTLAELQADFAAGTAVPVPTGVGPFPNLTFVCAVVPAKVYWRAKP